MSLTAEILAIGEFKSDIVEYLEYPSNCYRHTRNGAPIVEHLFGISEGSSLSKEFANLLGITDPWDFNQHKLDPKKFNELGLIQFVKTSSDYADDLNKLNVLISAGFKFYFLPNG